MIDSSKQQMLFAEPALPTIVGLNYIPNFLGETAETSLICTIDNQPWMSDLKRRVQHYGWRYDYKAKNISSDLRLGPLPEWLQTLALGLFHAGLFPQIPDQVIINEYQPGQGISAHIDCAPCFGNTIASLSLGSGCVMDLTHNHTGEKQSLLLEPRSLLILADDARYQWKHAIAARKTDRYLGHIIKRSRRISLTFRTVISQSS